MKIITLTILAFICLQGASNCAFAQNTPAVKKDTQSSPPTVSTLLEVEDPMFNDRMPARKDIIEVMTDVDLDFVFKPGKDVNGLPQYSAIDNYNTSLEIIGNENDIRILKWTVVFVPDQEVNTKELNRIARFVIIVEHQKGMQWLTDQVKQSVAVHPLVNYTISEELTKGRMTTFDYTPKLKCMSVTVTVNK